MKYAAIHALVLRHEAILDQALADEIAAGIGRDTAESYVLAIAHPVVPAKMAIAATAESTITILRDTVADALTEAGWKRKCAKSASNLAVECFKDRVVELVEQAPALAGGRA